MERLKGRDGEEPTLADGAGMGIQPGEEPEPPDMPDETPEEAERTTL